MAADRKGVLIRADPALWAQVDDYAAKEGIARNEAVIRLLTAGLSPGSGKAPEPAPAPEKLKPVPGKLLLHLAREKAAQAAPATPAKPALDLPVGPVSRAPGSMLKGKR